VEQWMGLALPQSVPCDRRGRCCTSLRACACAQRALSHPTSTPPCRFEIVCHIMLIASVMVVLARFNKYKSCQDPMAAWLVVDYGLVVCFRTLQICYTVISYPTSLPSLRTRRALRVACIAFQALFLYPFLCTWTVLGSVWYLRSGGCLPEDGQHLGFPVWLLLCYLGVCGMAFVFLRQLGSFTTLYREQEALAGNPGAAPFSAVLEEFGRLCLADRAVSWDETIDDFAHGDGWPTGAGQGARACALSPEDISTLVTFKVSSVQGGDETCMICLDDVRRGDTVRGLPCFHLFHAECVDAWLARSATCPRCRASVVDEVSGRVLPATAAKYAERSQAVPTRTEVPRALARAQSPGSSVGGEGFFSAMRSRPMLANGERSPRPVSARGTSDLQLDRRGGGTADLRCDRRGGGTPAGDRAAQLREAVAAAIARGGGGGEEPVGGGMQLGV